MLESSPLVWTRNQWGMLLVSYALFKISSFLRGRKKRGEGVQYFLLDLHFTSLLSFKTVKKEYFPIDWFFFSGFSLWNEMGKKSMWRHILISFLFFLLSKFYVLKISVIPVTWSDYLSRVFRTVLGSFRLKAAP